MLATSADNPTALSRVVPLPRPDQGGASRVQLGRSELVLEHRRGCFALLWSDGRDARRYVLGLRPSSELAVELRAPQQPVDVIAREAVTVLPGARLRGFVTVPLVPTVVWRDRDDVWQPLIELHPPALRAQWDEDRGHTYRCSSSWMVRFPYPSGEPQAVVPLRLSNVGDAPACPGALPVSFDDADLTPLRGTFVLRPRRLVLDCEKVRVEGDA